VSPGGLPREQLPSFNSFLTFWRCIVSFNLSSGSTPSRNVGRSMIESLEKRVLLHDGPLQVTSVVADNRGEIIITLNQPIRPSNVNTGAVQMYTGGPDGIVGNQDDTRVTTMLNWQPTGNRIVIRAVDVPADTGYRVKLVSTRMETPDGDVHLDGEFTGTFPSGDGNSGGQGVSGGNFEFQVKNDFSATPISRWSTSEGVMNVRLLRDTTPRTFSNFRRYMDAGNFDNIFFTRSVPGFIIQGGSLQISPQNQVVEGPVRDPILNEFARSNTRGTIAMAKQGGDPNSATNQFFFNLGDNSGNLDAQNGGFTVFGDVVGSSGLAVMDAIAARPTEDLSDQIGPFAATDVSTVPIRGASADPLNPSRDLVTIRRISQLMRVVRL
jgi:cyclophilin family peptidyl-prolyl cis-trans isomerase